jgi:hypothetical protein
MDFRSLLSHIPSGIEKEMLIKEVGDSDEKFTELLDLCINEKDPLAWRAAWILDGSDEQIPGQAEKHISGIVAALPDMHSTGSLRSLIRLLCRHEIPEDDQGILIDLCFSYLVSEVIPVAVKAHAMQIIYQHALIYPELKGELISILEDQMENNSVGFSSRGRRIIRDLKKTK